MTVDEAEPQARAELRAVLAAIVGGRRVHADAGRLRAAAGEGRRDGRAALAGVAEAPLPLAAVRPHTTEEVVGVLAVARERSLPVVTVGGGTGLMGGARSMRPG